MHSDLLFCRERESTYTVINAGRSANDEAEKKAGIKNSICAGTVSMTFRSFSVQQRFLIT